MVPGSTIPLPSRRGRTLEAPSGTRTWAKHRVERHAHHFLAVLRRIAEGHNDPRTLAKETIAEFER